MNVFQVESSWDGHNNVLTAGRQSTIRSDKPTDNDESSRWIDAFPGPSAIMGRGLSTLKNGLIHTNGTKVTFTGQAQDGSMIEAVIDPERGGLAREITRKYNGRIIGRFILSQPKQFDGVIIATKADYSYSRMVAKTVETVHQTFQITAASFKPQSQKLKTVFERGQTVLDLRGKSPVTWHIMREQSVDDVLKKTEDFFSNEAQKTSAKESQSSLSTWIIMIPSVIIVSAAGFLLRRGLS